MFSSDRARDREARLKRAVENTSALSTRVSVVSLKKKTFVALSGRKVKDYVRRRWNSWDQRYTIFIYLSMFRMNINNNE